MPRINKKWGILSFWSRRGFQSNGWCNQKYYRTKVEAQKALNGKLKLEEHDYEMSRWLIQVVKRRER